MPHFMMKTITTLLLLFQLTSFGQAVQIDTLLIPKKEKLTDFQADKLKFPIVKTTSRKIDSLINFDLKNRLTNNEFEGLPIDATIIKWADDQLIFLNFEVTYNDNGILSLNISAEGCGAYCTGWTEYYNYSTITGELLTLNEIVDAEKLKPKVIADKNNQYDEQRRELKKILLDKNSGLDNEGYEWALEYYNSCELAFELESFAIHKAYFEIIERCDLPNAIKSLTPVIELKYDYNDIREYLKLPKLNPR